MKYDTTITHSMKPVEDMPKKKPFLQILCSRLEFLPFGYENHAKITNVEHKYTYF